MKCFWYTLPHQMDTYKYICTCFPRTHTKKTWREKYPYDCPLIHDHVKPNNPIMVILFLYTSYFVKVVVYLRNIWSFISFHEVRQKDLHKLWKDLFTSLGLDDKGTELFTQSINQELFKQKLTTYFYSKHSSKQLWTKIL